MKTNCWKQCWLTAFSAIGCFGILPMIAVAQTETNSTPSPDIVAAATTNEAAQAVATEPAQESESAWDRRWKFKETFHQAKKGRHREAVVVFGDNAELKTNETAEAVVVIGGSATVRGKVSDAVVVIGGDINLEGAQVGDAVVAVLGSVKVGPGSTVYGDVVSVGGTTDVAEDATVEGQIQPVEFGTFGLPRLDWLKHWLLQCVFKLRPLAPTAQVTWVWIVAGAFFLFYLLVALALPKPVENCVAELTGRPATTVLMGLLTALLVPLILVVLTATGVGLLAVPFVMAAVFFAAAIGKVAFLEYLGFSLSRAFGGAALVKPLLAFVIGAAILTLLYLVPVLGLLTLCVTGMWGLGAAVMAVFGGTRREMPQRSSPPPASPLPNPIPGGTTANVAAFAPGAMPGVNPLEPYQPMSGAAGPGTAAVSAAVPAGAALVAEALAFPRANFWERLGAAFLDVILVSILGSLVGGAPLTFLVMLAYFAGMWTWRGTTVGGIVLNLKVVRLDEKPVTFAVALVRGLAAAFSAIVLFLGFFWMIFDPEKQTWHDKIAGTVVIRLPRGTPLVCL